MDLASDNFSGPWKKEMYADHLPDPSAFDQGFIQSVFKFCQPTTAVDLGCGQGYFVRWLRGNGVDAWGVEGEDLGTSFKATGYQIQQNLSHAFDLGKTYDMVMCTEVVEHIPEPFEDVVFDNIVRHTHRYLVFSGATPGQGGTGHINEKPEIHWFSCLVQRGFKLLDEASVQTRLASTLDWYVKNISIWELQPNLALSLEEAQAIAEQNSHTLRLAVAEQRLLQERQKVSFLTTQLHQSNTELYDVRTELHQTQVDLHAANAQVYDISTQLHKTQIALHDANTQLHQAKVEQYQMQQSLATTHADLEQARTQIWELQAHTEVLNHRLSRIRMKRQELRTKLNQAECEIEAVKSSKFWKLRAYWFRVKSVFGAGEA
jgi:SAM-dependent methyltransferase